MSKLLSKIERNPRIKYLPIPKLRFAWAMSQFIILRSAYSQLGWFKSAWKNSSIDKNGEPVPWITYSAIYFLETRAKLIKKCSVFEYGSGNSSLWWASHAKDITSVEYSQAWYDKTIKNATIPKNMDLLLRPNQKHAFADAILESKRTYDIVVIDGRDRVRCAENAPRRLSKKGIIIWDNSDRERYEKGRKYLRDQGFKQIDFFGMVPIDNKLEVTSIFYKPDNLFEI